MADGTTSTMPAMPGEPLPPRVLDRERRRRKRRGKEEEKDLTPIYLSNFRQTQEEEKNEEEGNEPKTNTEKTKKEHRHNKRQPLLPFPR